jgi:hypothetical protein
MMATSRKKVDMTNVELAPNPGISETSIFSSMLHYRIGGPKAKELIARTDL